MWIPAFAFGALIAFLAFHRAAKGGNGGGGASDSSGPQTPSPPKSLPPKMVEPDIGPPKKPPEILCTDKDKEFLQNIGKALKKETLSIALAEKAIPVAARCNKAFMHRLENFIKRQKQKEQAAKDKAEPLTGKDFVCKNKGGVFACRPQSFNALGQVKRLQRAVNELATVLKLPHLMVKVDGAVGSQLTGAVGSLLGRSGTKLDFPMTPENVAVRADELADDFEFQAIDDAAVSGDIEIGVIMSPFNDVSNAQWMDFVETMSTGETGDIDERGKLGMFRESPRRLQSLGLMQGVKPVTLESGARIFAGEFVEPLTLERYLRSPLLQYNVFEQNISALRDELRDAGFELDSLTLSGLLALAHCAGIRGARSWLLNSEDHSRFPMTTEMVHAANGIF